MSKIKEKCVFKSIIKSFINNEPNKIVYYHNYFGWFLIGR